jgi:hypothetical protein
LICQPLLMSQQESQLRNPDERIVFGGGDDGKPLGDYASSIEGLTTGDMERFLASYWERPTVGDGWEVFVQNVDESRLYGGRTDVVLWQNDAGALRASPSAHNFPSPMMNGRQILTKFGIRVGQMPPFACTLYLGEIFGKNAATVVPHDSTHLEALWCFLCSSEFREKVRHIDQSLKVTNATFTKVAFDLEHWQRVAAERYPDGLPKPHSSDPTQWLFNGHPKDSDNPLHVAVARLVGYQWPRQTGSEFPDCPALGPDGLEGHADADGIVCLSSVRGEPTAADRLLSLLADAYGPDWSADLRDKLLADVDAAGETLDDWLRDSFFSQHLKLFHQRPFVWHIWDGLRDGFHCLVNYHRLAGADGQGRRTLEKIAYEYLGDWITRQKAQQAAGEEGADGRVAAAVRLQEQLAKIIEGEPPFDIFVRWKPLAEQPVGWDPDINDGVRINIRPFMTARPLGAKAKKACILRAAPGIKWDKDRGNEPDRPKDQFPWFWTWDDESQDFLGGPKFDGKRHNDLHYTRKAKEAARAKAGGTSTKPKATGARA